MHRSFIFMTVVFNFSLLSTWKSILDCSRHFAEFLGKKQREKRGKKTSLSTRTKLNKFGRSLFWWIHRMCTPVLSLDSQQPVENLLQHRSGSETDRPGVVQWFPVNDSIGIPRNGTESRGDCLCSFTRRLRAMQTFKLRFVGGIVLFFGIFLKPIHTAAVPSRWWFFSPPHEAWMYQKVIFLQNNFYESKDWKGTRV